MFSYHSYLGGGPIDDFFGCQITLVADQEFVDSFACVAFDFLQPLLDVVERFLIRHVVNYYDTMSPSVITAKQWKTHSSLHCNIVVVP